MGNLKEGFLSQFVLFWCVLQQPFRTTVGFRKNSPAYKAAQAKLKQAQNVVFETGQSQVFLTNSQRRKGLILKISKDDVLCFFSC